MAIVAAEAKSLAQDVVVQLGVLAEDRGLTVAVDVPGEMEALVDLVMTRQALTNVLDNAIKFTPAGGRIRLWGERTGDVCRLVVDDDGPGIPREQRENVLERFYRLDAASACGRGGVGLGLAIVRWAMVVNGGGVTIAESEAIGRRLAARSSVARPVPPPSATLRGPVPVLPIAPIIRTAFG